VLLQSDGAGAPVAIGNLVADDTSDLRDNYVADNGSPTRGLDLITAVIALMAWGDRWERTTAPI